MNIFYPFSINNQGRTETALYDRHVRHLIEQVLFTNPGERVNRSDFGSGLLQLVFSPNSPEMAAALEANVHAALQRWLGDVLAIESLSVTSEDAKLTIALDYVVLPTGERRADVFERAMT